MELEEIFEYAGLIATLAVAAYAWRSLRGTPALRVRFLAALLGLTAYLNLKLILHGEELLTPFGVFDIWFRHLFFYAGQYCFFIFVNRVIFHRPQDQKASRRREGAALLVLLLLSGLQLASPHGAHASHEVSLLAGDLTPYRFLLYLTDQG